MFAIENRLSVGEERGERGRPYGREGGAPGRDIRECADFALPHPH